MTNYPLLYSIIDVLILIVPVLFTVAYITLAERKTMASMQRGLIPNTER
jgi:NADH-ubiquinone oxidoreductase chain 1